LHPFPFPCIFTCTALKRKLEDDDDGSAKAAGASAGAKGSHAIEERWLDMDDEEKEGHESTFHQNLILSALSLIFCSGRTIPHQEISGG
jgi:hypothetical protein